jgi:cytochrome c551/c552
MAVSRAERRAGRRTKVAVLFADETDRALDLLELMEIAWHDVHGEVTPPDQVILDVLALSRGDLDELIRWVRLAVVDWRDVRVAADEFRATD